MDQFITITLFVAVLTLGMMAGIYMIFSTTIMPSLARQPNLTGMSAMQTINTVIINPLFVFIFMGSGAASVLMAIWGLSHWSNSEGPLLAIGGATGFLGSIAVTGLRNVPMNTTLDAVDANSAVGPTAWATYLEQWTRWNHVRALATSVATVLLSMAIWERAA